MKTVLIYSGGLDSTVLLYDLLARGDDVLALSVDYGQRHFREIDSARASLATSASSTGSLICERSGHSWPVQARPPTMSTCPRAITPRSR